MRKSRAATVEQAYFPLFFEVAEETYVVKVDIRNPIDSDGNGAIDDSATSANGQTGNEFTYSSGLPAVLYVPVKVRVEPDTPEVRSVVRDRLRIRIGSISDSHGAGSNVGLAWDHEFPGEPKAGGGVYDSADGLWKATATFTNLPPLNSDFGRKTLTVQLLNVQGGVISTDTREFEVFWPFFKAGTAFKDSNFANNRPGADLNATKEDFANRTSMSASRAPNWFFYWLQAIPTEERTGGERYGGLMQDNLLRFAGGDDGFGDYGFAPAGAFFDQDYAGPMGRIVLFPHSASRSKDGITTGINVFRDTVVHERYHCVEQLIKWTRTVLGNSVSTESVCSATTWSGILNRGQASPAGRVFNHYVDLNGNGSVEDIVGETDIVPSPRDVDGDGYMVSAIREKVDDDQDDVPYWSDRDPTFDPAVIGDPEIEVEANAAEPRKESGVGSLSEQDWGALGKNYGK